MRRRRAPEARPPPPPSERRRHGRVCLGEPPATVAITSSTRAVHRANRPSRMETALLSQRVVFAHCTTPASGSSPIASSSACSRAAVSPTPGLEPGGLLERERDRGPGSARLGFERSVCSHCVIWSRTESGQVRIVSIASRSAPSSARSTAYLPLQDARSSNRTRPPARKVCGSRLEVEDEVWVEVVASTLAGAPRSPSPHRTRTAGYPNHRAHLMRPSGTRADVQPQHRSQ